MKETYIFLNQEDVEKNRVFLKALWESEISAIYKQFSRGRDIIQATLEEFVASMQEPPDREVDPTKLVLAQKSTLSRTGRVIRFLTTNTHQIDAEFCCDYAPKNLSKVETLFLQTYGSDINSYPHRMEQP